jgi:hypothetical protein
MSAFGGKADTARAMQNVRFGDDPETRALLGDGLDRIVDPQRFNFAADIVDFFCPLPARRQLPQQ